VGATHIGQCSAHIGHARLAQRGLGSVCAATIEQPLRFSQ